MRSKDGPNEKEEVNNRDPNRDGIFSFLPAFIGSLRRDIGLKSDELLTEPEVVEGVAGEHGGGGFPSEMREHVGDVPVPAASHHQDRWRGKMGEGTANGDVDKEQAEGGVSKSRRRA